MNFEIKQAEIKDRKEALNDAVYFGYVALKTYPQLIACEKQIFLTPFYVSIHVFLSPMNHNL